MTSLDILKAMKVMKATAMTRSPNVAAVSRLLVDMDFHEILRPVVYGIVSFYSPEESGQGRKGQV